MSLYGEKFKIGGLSCGLVLRGSANGEYRVVFEREYASLEQIEALEWDPPILEVKGKHEGPMFPQHYKVGKGFYSSFILGEGPIFSLES